MARTVTRSVCGAASLAYPRADSSTPMRACRSSCRPMTLFEPEIGPYDRTGSTDGSAAAATGLESRPGSAECGNPNAPEIRVYTRVQASELSRISNRHTSRESHTFCNNSKCISKCCLPSALRMPQKFVSCPTLPLGPVQVETSESQPPSPPGVFSSDRATFFLVTVLSKDRTPTGRVFPARFVFLLNMVAIRLH